MAMIYQTSIPNGGLPQTADTPPHHQDPSDLHLHTGWFANTRHGRLLRTTRTITLPTSITRHNPNYYVLCTPHPTQTVLTITICWTANLSRTQLILTYDPSHPVRTVQLRQHHFPPPTPVHHTLLAPLAARGHEIARYCADRLGKKVQRGECWDLGLAALVRAAGVMRSQGESHGACIFSYFPQHQTMALETAGAGIVPGDVVQFLNSVWREAGGGVVQVGMPDHTCVVERARRDGPGGWVLEVLEQNVGGVKRVVRGMYRIGYGSTMVSGGLRVFRPVPEEWGWDRMNG